MAIFKLSLILCIFTVVGIYAQSQNPVAEQISHVCLGCICEAASGCNRTIGCAGDVCGPFRITWGYWADAGKPTLNDEPNTMQTAYANCVNDAGCAAKTFEGYMAKYAMDCNGDGRINCDDYIRIHRHGGYGCKAPLDPKFESIYTQCMAVFASQQ